MQRPSRVLIAAALVSAPVLSLTVPAAAASADPAGPSYADVLARPDDAALNMAYAIRLVREGHLNAAAATLERVLLLNPEADDVRVTYMIVLYRLDDLAGAKREADILKTRRLAGPLAAEYARYAERIFATAKPTRFSAYLGSGVRMDSNVTLATDDNGVKPRDGDIAYVSMAGAAVEHRPSSGPIDAVFAQFNLGSRRNAEHSEFDLLTVAAEAGLEKRFGGLVLRLSGFADAAAVDAELFSRAGGGRARATYEIDARWKVFADLEGGYDSYDDIAIAEHEAAHDGSRWRFGGGVALQATDQHQIIVQAHWTDKDAINSAYAYAMRDVEAKWLGTFSAGQYASLGVRYAQVDYDGFDSEYETTRADDVLRARLSYGLPLRTLGSWFGVDASGAPLGLGDLVLQTSLDYVDQRSNIADFDHSSLGGDVLLTRRVQF